MEKKALIVGVEIMVDADDQDCCHGDCPYLAVDGCGLLGNDISLEDREGGNGYYRSRRCIKAAKRLSASDAPTPSTSPTQTCEVCGGTDYLEIWLTIKPGDGHETRHSVCTTCSNETRPHLLADAIAAHKAKREVVPPDKCEICGESALTLWRELDGAVEIRRPLCETHREYCLHEFSHNYQSSYRNGLDPKIFAAVKARWDEEHKAKQQGTPVPTPAPIEILEKLKQKGQ